MGVLLTLILLRVSIRAPRFSSDIRGSPYKPTGSKVHVFPIIGYVPSQPDVVPFWVWHGHWVGVFITKPGPKQELG